MLEKFGMMLLAIAVFAAVVGAVLLLAGLFKGRRADRWVALLFAGPALALVLVGLVWPTLLTVVASFRGASGNEGFTTANYAAIATRPDLRLTIANTAIWTLAVPVIATVIGLAYAVIVDRAKGEALAKTLIFLPMAISMVGASIIWKFVYEYKPPHSAQIGLLNQLRVLFGMQPTQFLLNRPWNTLALIVVMVWVQAGFAMTVLSASIKAIPDETIEAATIDGATGWKLFRNVILPGIRNSLVVVLTTIAIASLKAFDVVRTMTGGNFGTSVVANEFYNAIATQHQPGLGAALAVLLFVLVTPIIAYNVHQLRKARA